MVKMEKTRLTKIRKGMGLTVLLLLVIVVSYNALFSFSYSVGPNYRNVSIDTRVNITNAGPEVRLVTLPQPGILLTAGGITAVTCNVTVEDYNGASDINYTSAVFYHSSSTPGAADDNRSHYTNTNCTETGAGGDFKNFTCEFNVTYYAYNGTWTCNATAFDARYNGTGSNTTTMFEILALNVTTQVIDYGNMSVGDTSGNRSANVTNLGNVDINVSVRGYGATDFDGLAFDCERGSISVENQRYSLNVGDDYASKTPLSSTFTHMGLTIPRQAASGTPPTSETFWQLYVPPNPFGECNGTLVFQAESLSPG
jgi:hypothetical protein